MAVALDLAQLDACLREERERLHVPGIVLALERAGETHVFADGAADLERGEAVTAETSFRIASVTKPFVGSLAHALSETGRFALDESLVRGASTRQLLSHQGGLACEWPHPLDRYGDGDDALQRLVEDEPASLPVGPGELFSYSNVGYWFVGAAIARATGDTFEAAVSHWLLEPLGLRHTGFAPASPAARGYEQVAPEADEHRPAEDSYPRVRRPSGGLWSTVGDLLRFGAHLVERPALHEPLVGTPDGGYGLGLALRDLKGRRIVEHVGSAAGFQSLLLLVPEERLVLAALTNSSRGRRVIRAGLELLGLEAAPEAHRRPDDELAPFEGRYRDDWLDARVRVADGALELAIIWVNVFTDEREAFPPVRAEAIGRSKFVVLDGDGTGDVVDFPRPGLGRFGGLVVPRVPE